MAKVNGYAIGASAALDEAHTRHYAELLVEKAGKSLDSNVQRAATELQDQLDFGSAPTEKDIGHLVSVLDKAGETNVVDNVIREVEHDPLDTKNMESATEENAENGQVVEAEELSLIHIYGKSMVARRCALLPGRAERLRRCG